MRRPTENSPSIAVLRSKESSDVHNYRMLPSRTRHHAALRHRSGRSGRHRPSAQNPSLITPPDASVPPGPAAFAAGPFLFAQHPAPARHHPAAPCTPRPAQRVRRAHHADRLIVLIVPTLQRGNAAPDAPASATTTNHQPPNPPHHRGHGQFLPPTTVLVGRSGLCPRNPPTKKQKGRHKHPYSLNPYSLNPYLLNPYSLSA